MEIPKIIVIAGPTAVGKTRYAIAVARAMNGEIISCDSMQLYRYMDIGSAKPTAEERAAVVHHLVDTVDPATPFSVAQYQQMAKCAIADVLTRGRVPVIAGGTGLYLHALLYEMDFAAPPAENPLRAQLQQEALQYGPSQLHQRLMAVDPAAAARIHPNNTKKVIRALESALQGESVRDFQRCQEKCQDYHTILIGLTRNRPELYDRINSRVDALVAQGLFDEVRGLLNRGLTADDISMKGIGYKEIIAYFAGDLTREAAIDLIKKNTRHLAKRQLTWFRRYADMRWFNLSDYANDETALTAVIKDVREQWQRK